MQKVGKHSKACIVQGVDEALRFGTQTVMENLWCNFLTVNLKGAGPSPSATPTDQRSIFCLQVHACCTAPTERTGSHTALQLTARDSKFFQHSIPLISIPTDCSTKDFAIQRSSPKQRINKGYDIRIRDLHMLLSGKPKGLRTAEMDIQN